MANWKSAVKELNELNARNTEYGKIKEHDLYNGLADSIIDNKWDKENKKWKVEYAEQILKEKKEKMDKKDKETNEY